MPNLWHGGYDYVVIQQKSHPFEGEITLIEQGNALFQQIKKAGSKAVLFSTWSEKNNPDGQQVIDAAFQKLHDLCEGNLLAPCGAAWHSLRGILDLYAGDGEHQNACGAYLNACILAKTIFGINPTALPEEIESRFTTRQLLKDEIMLLQKTASGF